MSKITKIGSFAFKKHGAENITLFQLSQAEEDMLWGVRVVKEKCPVQDIETSDYK